MVTENENIPEMGDIVEGKATTMTKISFYKHYQMHQRNRSDIESVKSYDEERTTKVN